MQRCGVRDSKHRRAGSRHSLIVEQTHVGYQTVSSKAFNESLRDIIATSCGKFCEERPNFLQRVAKPSILVSRTRCSEVKQHKFPRERSARLLNRCALLSPATSLKSLLTFDGRAVLYLQPKEDLGGQSPRDGIRYTSNLFNSRANPSRPLRTRDPSPRARQSGYEYSVCRRAPQNRPEQGPQ
jgi:hypothetical protein